MPMKGTDRGRSSIRSTYCPRRWRGSTGFSEFNDGKEILTLGSGFRGFDKSLMRLRPYVRRKRNGMLESRGHERCGYSSRDRPSDGHHTPGKSKSNGERVSATRVRADALERFLRGRSPDRERQHEYEHEHQH